MNHNYHVQKNPFEISELAEFDNNINHLPEEDQKRKRIAYIKQSMAMANHGQDMKKSFGCMMLPFYIIPIFWPILYFQKKAMNNAFNLLDTYIDSALDYWQLSRIDLEL